MIVVLASRHDRVAGELVARWPAAALCSAEDLTRPGWAWSVPSNATGSAAAKRRRDLSENATWVIHGDVVPDQRVSGVFVRRSTVHAEELTGTHRDDRAYLAAEMHAFLVHVLARTGALVANPIDETGAYGEAALRPERWLAAAADAGVIAAPLRIRSRGQTHPPAITTSLEVVGERVVGPASSELSDAAVQVCRRLGLRWAVAAFDERERLSSLSTTPAPSLAAAEALARLLSRGRAT